MSAHAPPQDTLPEYAQHAICRALLEHTVPVCCAEDAGVEYPVDHLSIGLHLDADLTPPDAVRLRSLGYYSATLEWHGEQPLVQCFSIRLPDFAGAGWITARIAWIREIHARLWRIGCLFDWTRLDPEPTDG